MSSYGEELYGGGLYAGSLSSDDPGDDSWIVIGGAITDTVANGPAYYTDEFGFIVSNPGDTVVPLSLTLSDRDAIGVSLDSLDDTFSRSFRDEANETGTASFAITNDAAAAVSLALDQIVTFNVYGNKALSMIIETLNKVTYNSGEEYDQITVATGRGHLALWEQFVLYPSRGPDSLPVEEDRVFNWSAVAYNDAGWKYAKNIARWDVSSAPWSILGHKAPEEWPDPYSYWIWHSSGTTMWAKPGVCYFRKTFTVPANVTQVAIYYAFDNRGKIYIDGIPFAEQDGSNPAWDQTKFITVDVTPGPHLIAVEAYNDVIPGAANVAPPPVPISHTVVSGDTLWSIAQRYYGSGIKWREIYDANQAQIQADATTAGLWDPYDPGHWIFPGQVFTIPGINQTAGGYWNPGGIIMAVYVQTATGPTTLLTRTDSSWKIVGYPEDPPGMTPGEVIRLAKREASRRGNDFVDMLTLKFTDTVDSAGNAWPVVADIASKVGTDYLVFLLELTANYIDLWMAPGTLDLYAWNKGTRSKTRAVTLHGPTDEDDPESGNLYELSHTIMG